MNQNCLTSRAVIFLFFFLASIGFSKFATSQCLPGTLGDTGDTDAVSSRDPNALTGPAGFGPKHYFPADKLIAYRIDFENDYTAAVPAQQVDITNQLEEGLDWASFHLTEIGFGDQFIPVPPGKQQFQEKVPMTYSGINFEVWINAGIDVSTGMVYAHFYSVDPDWPLPADIGFLPPEDGTGRGMGHIGYTINHVKDLEEGSEIRNVALIVFDGGEHIYTNQIDPHDPSQGTDPELEAPITIDRGTPVSSMGSMPGEVLDKNFFVHWGGSDSASGVASYNIYVRDSQEVQWQLWLERTTETSAEFIGTPGHTHEFYSIAIDNVGHFEQKHPVPDAKVFVNPEAAEDSDNDGVIDDDDNCPSIVNENQEDLDEDSLGDLCDACPLDPENDIDGDGVCGEVDTCPDASNSDQADLDQDGLGDVCDVDDDADGIFDASDNCPLTANSDQSDLDQDGLGDTCDADDDADGVADSSDNCPLISNVGQSDLEGDGLGDLCDPDDDGDSVVDNMDNCPIISNNDQSDLDGDNVGDLCDICPLDSRNDVDGDGICGDVDNCQEISNSNQADLDQDGLGDICDPQTCGNGILETAELCDDSNFFEGDGCSSLCISESNISVKKAEIEWDEGLLKYKGNIALPFGVFPENIIPQSDILIEIANFKPIEIGQVVFDVKGATGEKWEFKGDGSLKKFRIDWKGSTFDYKGIIHVKANHVGQDNTSLEIEREGLVGEFSIQLGSVTVHVGADNTVVTFPSTIEMDTNDNDDEIEVEIPFALSSDMIMVVRQPDQPATEIVVGDYLTSSVGTFDLQTGFDPAGHTGLDLPAIVKVRISLGQVGYPGYSEISTGWKAIKEKEWKYE